MPQTVLTVFLSSTAQDLKAHREAVYERLRPIPFLKCTRMEDFGALNADGVKACRDGVKDADLFVGLVGMRRGWEPQGDSRKRSITEMEHDWAKENNCARFLHVSPDTFPVPGNLYEPKDLIDRQTAFRDRVMSETVIAKTGFDAPHLMASAVVENLLTQILRDPRLTQAIQSGGLSASDETLSDINAVKLLSAADAAGVTAQAAHAGVDRIAIFEFARRLKQSEVSDIDQAMKELSAAVDVAINVAQQGRGDNLDSLVKEVLGTVAEKTKAGDLEGAAREADLGFKQWQEQETERRERSVQGGLALLKAGLEQDILRRDAVSAAAKVVKMVELEFVDQHDRSKHFKALNQHHNTFFQRGFNMGVNFDLQVAVEISKKMLTAAENAHENTDALTARGRALQILGERERGNKLLEQAIASYRAALEICVREIDPVNWGIAQSNLGVALMRLGERENNSATIQAAIRAFQAALLECTRDRRPRQWATIQNNLGGALGALGEREKNSTHFEQAADAFRAALDIFNREQTPGEWAMTQSNLASALSNLGAIEGNSTQLEHAIKAYRSVLQVRTRENSPVPWAITKKNLGRTLLICATRESGTKHLKEAIDSFDLALGVFEAATAIPLIDETRNLRATAQKLLAKRRPVKI